MSSPNISRILLRARWLTLRNQFAAASKLAIATRVGVVLWEQLWGGAFWRLAH